MATRPAVTPETLRAAERGLALLHGAGFPVDRALDTLNALTLFTVASAASEASTAAVNSARAAGSQDYLAGLDEAEFPLLTDAARSSKGTDDGARLNSPSPPSSAASPPNPPPAETRPSAETGAAKLSR